MEYAYIELELLQEQKHLKELKAGKHPAVGDITVEQQILCSEHFVLYWTDCLKEKEYEDQLAHYYHAEQEKMRIAMDSSYEELAHYMFYSKSL